MKALVSLRTTASASILICITARDKQGGSSCGSSDSASNGSSDSDSIGSGDGGSSEISDDRNDPADEESDLGGTCISFSTVCLWLCMYICYI